MVHGLMREQANSSSEQLYELRILNSEFSRNQRGGFWSQNK